MAVSAFTARETNRRVQMMCEFEPFVNAACEQMLSASIPNEMNHRLGVHVRVLSIGTFNASLVLHLGMEELRQGLITRRLLSWFME